MAQPTAATGLLNLPDEIERRKKIILGELRERTLWFIKLRWCVPVSMGIGIAVARWIGVEFKAGVLLLLASFILTYNVVFFLLSRRVKSEPHEKQYIERFTYWQVGFDYGTMFLLIYFTGGLASPFIFFFIFHITFSAIFLPRRSAYSLAAIAAIGVGLISAAEYFGWIPHHDLLFQGKAVDFGRYSFRLIVIFGFFSGFVFITAVSITAVMRMLEKRIVHLADLTETVTTLNDKLNTLYTMTQAIRSEEHLEQVLNIVSSELARVMDVQAISIKLLSEDGKLLHFAAAHGLPEEFLKHKTVEVTKSPFNRRVIEGEPFVSGHVTEPESFQFGEDLEAAGLRSVQYVPLIVETRVIGILGAYSTRPEQFGPEELNFFRQAAGLVAIAIENARQEEIRKLTEQHLMRSEKLASIGRLAAGIAHEINNPLTSVLTFSSLLLRKADESQREKLEIIVKETTRCREIVRGLLNFARQSEPKKELCNLNRIVEEALSLTKNQLKVSEKKISVETELGDLPSVHIDPNQTLEVFVNIIINAVDAMPQGGTIRVHSAPLKSEPFIEIRFSDTGCGIPKENLEKIFDPFFTTKEAGKGTGLGLAVIYGIVERHNGSIDVESEVGKGTTFIVKLPMD